MDTTLHGGSTIFYTAAFIHTNFFSVVLFCWGFLNHCCTQICLCSNQGSPSQSALYLALPTRSMWQDMDLALLTRHFYPAPCCPFSEETLFGEYCPTRCGSILHLKACLVLAASTAPMPSPQGIEGTCPASHVHSAAQTAMLLSQQISLVTHTKTAQFGNGKRLYLQKREAATH